MHFLLDITYVTYIITIIIFLIFLNRNKNINSIIIFSYILYSLTNDILTEKHILSKIGIDSNILLYVFTIVEFLLLFIYLFLFLQETRVKKFLLISAVIFLLIASYNFFENNFKSFKSVDTIFIAVSSIILIVGSIVYLFESIQKPDIDFIYSKPSFWVVVGIMIYFSGTFFLFLQYENLSESDKKSFWIINMICFILKNIFFSISFILKPENQQISNVDDYYLNKLE